jgi:hypothetical protein
MLVHTQYRDLGVEVTRDLDREPDGTAGVLRAINGYEDAMQRRGIRFIHA